MSNVSIELVIVAVLLILGLLAYNRIGHKR
jgi:hypothetical protein